MFFRASVYSPICASQSHGIRMIRGWIDVLVGVSVQFEKNSVDRRVERRQLEGLSEYRCLHSLEEKLDRRIVLVAGKKNEPPSSRRPDPRHRPVEHLAPDFRHHHVANDEIKGALHDLAQALDTARDGGHLIRAEDQVVAENLPEIITIFQQQNSPGRPPERRYFLVNVESDELHGIGSLQWPAHCPKPISRTGALGTVRDALVLPPIGYRSAALLEGGSVDSCWRWRRFRLAGQTSGRIRRWGRSRSARV